MKCLPRISSLRICVFLVATIFCDQDYQLARSLIDSGAIRLNGQAVYDLLQMVQSGDVLSQDNDARMADLYALRKANALRRQMEQYWGGPEVAYQHLGELKSSRGT